MYKVFLISEQEDNINKMYRYCLLIRVEITNQKILKEQNFT